VISRAGSTLLKQLAATRDDPSDTPNGKPFVFTQEQQEIAIEPGSVLGLKFGSFHGKLQAS
jgi:hypothetical protein